jgi:uncharacterized protein YxjI
LDGQQVAHHLVRGAGAASGQKLGAEPGCDGVGVCFDHWPTLGLRSMQAGPATIPATEHVADPPAAIAYRGHVRYFPIRGPENAFGSYARRGRGDHVGLLRRHEERRDEGAERYQMREKIFSIGDDYWIENSRGERAFKVDGKALRIRETMILEDPSGAELCKIQEKELRVRDTMEIERHGDTWATVKRALISPVRQRYSVDVHDGDDLDVHGNIVDHEYTVERGGDKVAEVSKRWFRVRETYGIEISPGQDVPLILAVAACLDRMSHE